MLPQPPVPASTVAYVNTTGQAAAVTLTGGTVTSVEVNGTQVATATPVTVTVPAGASITVTYTVAPAWAWSTFTPAVPASEVALLNDTGQDISVALTGGTVTSVEVNGTQVATATPANVMVPAGASITVTYTVAPAWAWMNYPDMAGGGSLGGAYAASNTVADSGGSGYSPVNDLPYAAHGEGGFPGFGVGVSN
jgi:hypothetical protein